MEPKKELEAIVKDVIEKRDRIIPIIGDDCFVGYLNLDGQQTLVSLQEWIAVNVLNNEIESDTIREISTGGYRGLDILFDNYMRINEDCGFQEYKSSVNSCVEDGIKEKMIFLRKDIKEFLLAAKFEVVATTSPFPILENELVHVNSTYNVCSYSPASPKREIELPAIYKLFGDCQKDAEFVLREDELLKFLHYLNRDDASYKCSLAKYMEDKGGEGDKTLGLLMPIGCSNLPNWLFRFLWYPFSYKCLTINTRISQDAFSGGIWHKRSTDEDFYKFLRKSHFKTFSKSNNRLSESTFDENCVLKILTDKFQEIDKGISEEVRKRGVLGTDEWDIFISYASEDFEIANAVCEILTSECKKNVWFDDRKIKPGDLYWEAIQYGIEHSHKFIFIITESYLNKAINKSSGVNEELKRLKYHFLRKRLDGKSGYSFPLILDGTKVAFKNNEGEMCEIPLVNGSFETLYMKDEQFKELQEPTEILFSKRQDIIFDKWNLRENLKNIFNL